MTGIQGQCCFECGTPLTSDDCGMYRKICDRDATEFLCIKCISEKYCADEEKLREKAEFLKKSGCTLFYM